MSKFATSSLSKSFSYALKGIRIAFKSQQNFRTQILMGSIALVLSVFMKFTMVEFCLLLFVIAIVLICELINSVIEFVLDATYRNKYSKLVEMSKDMSAGAVLIATFLSIIIGSLLFLGKISALIGFGM